MSEYRGHSSSDGSQPALLAFARAVDKRVTVFVTNSPGSTRITSASEISKASDG